MKKDDPKKNQKHDDVASNQSRKTVDKAPGKAKGKGEKLTEKDLKGKKIDGDPSQQADRPDN